MIATSGTCQMRAAIVCRISLMRCHPSANGQRPVIKHAEYPVFKQRASFAKHRHNMHRVRRPVRGHKPRQSRIAIGHLNRERQVADVFEIAQKQGDIVIPEITVTNRHIWLYKAPRQNEPGERGTTWNRTKMPPTARRLSAGSISGCFQ